MEAHFAPLVARADTSLPSRLPTDPTRPAGPVDVGTPAALQRVLSRYRRDVHHLPERASGEALTSLEGHLRLQLPPGLRRFLATHDGANLFRGALRIRSAAEMVAASEKAPMVVLFADSQDESRWAWAEDGDGGHVFGRWVDDRLEGMHRSFQGWLAGCLAVIETRVHKPEDCDQLRFEADAEDPIQLVRAGGRALRQGRPEEATDLLLSATRADPTSVRAWQYLGEALAISDRGAAWQAWLQALRRTRFPLPWPGADCLDPDVVQALSSALPDAEAWEKELRRFLHEQVGDVKSAEAASVVVAAATALSRSLVGRGKRAEGREVLADLLSRATAFTWSHTPWDALLELVRLEISLGRHDEAEGLLRRLRQTGPAELRGRGLLLLAEIATTRQEPWAEDLFEDAVTAGLDEVDKLHLDLLKVERAIRANRPADARALVAGADKVARRLGSPALEAAVAAAHGDVARLEGKNEAAAAAYSQALHLVGDRHPETRYRIRLRQSDLGLAMGDRAASEEFAIKAARGFARHGLPVREAWALLRLARYREGSAAAELLDAARARFLEADLATGVAAVDSVLGDPGASLPWHLERATAQARARHAAQLPRPPWERADADRPERRLGAHRFAIAACDEGIVKSLAQQMESAARAAGVGGGRPLDPPVLRYVAAVDLLSGHRSWAAASVLLDHLLQQRVEGPAWRALQGAIARSPNAALVDGLLRCVERPAAYPGAAVCAAAELLGLRREPSATGPLVNLASSGSPMRRRAAVGALGRIGNRSAVDAIAAALEEPQLAESAALSLLMLGDRRGIDFHNKALTARRTDLSGHPGEIVGRYGGPDHLLALAPVARGEDEMAMGALQGLGLLGDPRGVPALLEALHSRNRKVVEIASGALGILTGHHEDPEEAGLRGRWTTWWASEQGRFKEGVRFRDGRRFDCGLLLDKMAHDDPWVRRTSYDELVITSGKDLPFDADGPWRVQVAHLRAWRRWWVGASARFPAGRWFLDGREL